MTNGEHARIVSILAEVLDGQHWDRLGEVFHTEATLEFPQSGERFRGLANIRAQFENYPALAVGTTRLSELVSDEHYALTPTYTVIRVEGAGERGTAILRTRYSDGTNWWVINIHEFREGLLTRVITYFAPDFEAPDWRGPYREAP